VIPVSLLLPMAWRNVWRNKRRTLLTILALGIGVWSMIVLAALMDAWGQSTFDATVRNLTGHGQIHAKGYLDDPGIEHRFASPDDRLRSILDAPEVAAWAPRVRVPAIVQTERDNSPVVLVGIDPARERGLSFIANAVHEGTQLGNATEPTVLLGRKLARRLHTGVGRRVVLMSQGRTGNIAERGFRVVGIFTAENEQLETRLVFVPIEQAQGMLDIGTQISEIAFVLHDINKLPRFLQRLRTAAPALDVSSWSELEPFTAAILQISDGTVALWTVVMFILVAFGVVNTLLMAVYERTREFGILQALGLRPRLILIQVLMESLALVGIGVVVGLAGGALTVLSFHNGLDLGVLAKGAVMFGASRVLHPQLNVTESVYIGLFVWGMGILTSLYPAWRAAREVPVETINKSY
jgi:ABC-type lipoprotein release transport system permease subunit